jgi:uncharacterized protein YlxW (UPF0749 family)
LAARTPAGGSHIGLTVVLLLLGFLLSVGVAKERVRERSEPARRGALEQLIRDRQATIRGLAGQTARLSERLDGIEAAAAQGSGELGGLLQDLEALESQAGLGPASGPGVLVELADSARAPGGQQQLSDLTVQDVDLQLVVNALWRSGAEAVAVNGRRVASTTAIRSAGGSVLVNFARVASPYRIVALGDAAGLRRRLESSEIAERFDVWTQVYGLGFAVRERGSLRVPGLRASELEFARPAA